MSSTANLKPDVTESSEDSRQVQHFPLKNQNISTVKHFLSVSQASVLRHDLGKRKRNLG